MINIIYFYFQNCVNIEILDRLSGPLQSNDPLLVNYLKSYYLEPPTDKPYNLIKTSKYHKEMEVYTLAQVRSTIKTLYGNQKHGFFIEAGALDGQFFSSTLWLEQNLQWNGLLIEPDPDNFNDLVKKNRKAWISHSCISTEIYPKQILLNSPRRSTGFSVFPGYFRGNSHDSTFTSFDTFFGEVEYNVVQCFPIHTYLLALNITKIDILSLDTQGGEDKMLYSIPWELVDITTIIVEHYNYVDISKKQFDHELVHFMNSKGYILLALTFEPDYIFIKNNHILIQNYHQEIIQKTIHDKLNMTLVKRVFKYS